MRRTELFKKEKIKHGLNGTITDKEKKLLDLGVPFQKIIGFINFDDLQINLNRNVLIPRYETQELVEKALEYIQSSWDVLEIGTGSGYIGLTLAQKSNAQISMVDIDPKAIMQSKENAKFNNIKVNIFVSNIFSNVNGKFDMIISNPPYIPEHTVLDNSVLKNEPRHALFAGVDGNEFYKKIIEEAPKYLKPNGMIIFEISPSNKEYIESEGFIVFKDINKKERIALKTFN